MKLLVGLLLKLRMQVFHVIAPYKDRIIKLLAKLLLKLTWLLIRLFE